MRTGDGGREKGRLPSWAGAVALATGMVASAALLAVGARVAAGKGQLSSSSATPAASPTAAIVSVRATEVVEPEAAPSPSPVAFPPGPVVTPGERPPPVVTPGPGRPRLEVATPSPEDSRATVRAARAGQPRQQRPLSDPGPPSAQPAPAAAAPGPAFSLPMPVPGRWQVTCGYHCGLHDGLHAYGLDLVRLDGPTAGTPVRAPVGGHIVAVVDGTTAYCGGQRVTGIAAGSVVVLEFILPDGRTGHLRLIHLDGGSIPPSLRPRGAPVPVAAGAYLGSLAYIGPGCAHLHLDLAAVEGMREVPLPLSIAGRHLPDCGREGCWNGTVLP